MKSRLVFIAQAILFFPIILLGQLSDTAIGPFSYSSKKTFTGRNGCVVCAHPLASKVGQSILLQGGNAFDAAIAVQLALAVVYPEAGNIGGGGFMVAHLSDGKSMALDFREVGPGKAWEQMYIDPKTNKLIPDLSQEGHLSVGVPGTVAGLFATLKYARLPFATLIQPAINLAKSGFAITQREADNLNSTKSNFVDHNLPSPVFVKSSGIWHAGDTLIQSDLGETLEKIKENGASGFYKGSIARKIVSEMQRGGGIINKRDLANYTVKERTPSEFDYRGHHIITMPLPSSGGVLLQQMLKMLESRPIGQMGFHSTRSIQLITEVERRAYADRAEYLGDPDFVDVPVAKLTSNKYLKNRMADFDSTKAGVSSLIKAGIVTESNETTHLCIVDKEGNCVSITTTLNGLYGSKTVVAGAGFLLNNEMDDFSAQPGTPNMYGAIGGKANAIASGKRMLSSMSPTIVLKDGRPFMVVGTPGGTTIITSVLQSIINVIDFGMGASDAVNKAKFHHQWLPDRIDIEDGISSEIRAQLLHLGYTLNVRKPWSRTEMIKLDYSHNIDAAADTRGDDSVEGY